MEISESRIDGLFLGKIRDRWPGKAPSAIAKISTTDTVYLTETGFTGDEQADLSVHGGTEKAVHHYAADHYPFWRERHGDLAVLQPGGFGENISTLGFTENTVCLGDIYTMGAATVQVSQGRQPCWKLNRHTTILQMAFDFQQTGQTGWYYRVLEEGDVRAGQTIKLIERIHPNWTVKDVTRARLSNKTPVEIAEQLAAIKELAPSWRSAFQRKVSANAEEDTSDRLGK